MLPILHVKKTICLSVRIINYRILSFCALFMMFGLQALSEPSEKIQFLTEDLAPFQYYEAGKLTGVNVKKIRSVIKLAGLSNARIDVFPWARSYQTVLTNNNTFIFSIVRTKERENKFIWVCQLDSQQYGLFGRQSMVSKISSIEDAKQFKTIVALDDLAHQLLLNKGFKKNHNLIVSSNLDTVYKMFLAGKADLLVANKLAFNFAAKKFGYNENQWHFIVDIPELRTGHYLATNKKTNTQLIDKIRKAMEVINKENGGCQY